MDTIYKNIVLAHSLCTGGESSDDRMSVTAMLVRASWMIAYHGVAIMMSGEDTQAFYLIHGM